MNWRFQLTTTDTCASTNDYDYNNTDTWSPTCHLVSGHAIPNVPGLISYPVGNRSQSSTTRPGYICCNDSSSRQLGDDHFRLHSYVWINHHASWLHAWGWCKSRTNARPNYSCREPISFQCASLLCSPYLLFEAFFQVSYILYIQALQLMFSQGAPDFGAISMYSLLVIWAVLTLSPSRSHGNYPQCHHHLFMYMSCSRRQAVQDARKWSSEGRETRKGRMKCDSIPKHHIFFV